MKKISIVFAAALSLAAFSGCKKKGGGDCASSISGSIDRAMAADKDSKDESKKAAMEMAKAMMPKIKDALIASCTNDKWSPDVLKCYDDAKTETDTKMCDAKLTPDQLANEQKSLMTAMGMGDMAKDMGSAMAGSGSAMAGSGSAMMGSGSAMAGSGSAAMDGSGSGMAGSGSAAMAGSGSAAMAGSAAPAAGGANLPAECNDYKAMVDKMASCDKLDKSIKDAMKQSYDGIAASFAGASTPEAAAAFAPGCKAGADALKASAASICGW